MNLYKIVTENVEFYVIAPDKDAAIQKIYELIERTTCMIVEIPYKVHVVTE